MGLRSVTAACAVILAGASIVGCDTLKSMGIIHTDPVAERGERLRVPPDLSKASINDSFAVPGGDASASAVASSGGSRLANPVDKIEVHKAGSQRWLTVEAAPEQVWKWLHGYLDQHAIPIARESVELGLVQTDWIPRSLDIPRGVFSPEVKDAGDARIADYYSLRVEQGSEAGSTDVYVAHRRIATEQPGADANWSLRPSDPFLEAEMLRGFMLYLGRQPLDSIQQVAAAEARTPQASLERDASGRVKLALPDGYSDAWRRVGIAIDRLGFTLEDRNRSEGQYFIRYDPEAESGHQDPGFLASLAFWREDAPDTVPLYVISLSEAGERTLVDVTDEAGEPVDAALSERILALLDEQLARH